MRELCRGAERECISLGYEPVYLTDRLDCEAKQAGYFLGNVVRCHRESGRRLAVIAGGETIVRLTGAGKGGRNQELALAACSRIAGMQAAVISVGSDGTDGPTDAAGGYVDGDSLQALTETGIDPEEVLSKNDSYHALEKIGGLVMTGPTGTNVNDICIALIR